MTWMPAFLLALAPYALVPSASASAQDSSRAYLEHRNDLGLIAYCSDKGWLPADSTQFFEIGIAEIYGKPSPTPKGDLHERKGREGISHLEGEEQTLAELAAENNVEVAEVCEQYKVQIKLGKAIAAGKKAK